MSKFEEKFMKCYNDWCERGSQYCVEEKEKCFKCADVADLCGQPQLSWQCDGFCKGEKEKNKLDKAINYLEIKRLNGTLTEMLGSAVVTVCDNKWLILTSSTSVALLALVIFLTVWICRRKRTTRGSSIASSLSKPEDIEEGRPLDNDNDDSADNDQPEMEMDEFRDVGIETSDQSTSMTSLLQVNHDRNQQMPAPQPSELATEISGCTGPKDFCIRGLPNAMKVISPQETDRPVPLYN